MNVILLDYLMLMCVCVYVVHVRAEEDPADRPGEPGENTEGD